MIQPAEWIVTAINHLRAEAVRLNFDWQLVARNMQPPRSAQSCMMKY